MSELYIHGPDAAAGLEIGHGRAFPDAETALASLEQTQSDAVLLCDVRLAGQVRRPPADVWDFDLQHAGLSLGAAGTFQTAMLASLNWFFLDPRSDRRCTSWKATAGLCWIRPEVVRAVGGFDPAYTSADSRLMDLAYRVLVAGGRIAHDPQWLGEGMSHRVSARVPLEDEFIFLCRHLGRREASYAAAWHGITQRQPRRAWDSLKMAWERVTRHAPPRAQPDAVPALRLMGHSRRQQIRSISAIIPTINRYDYLPKAIESLLCLQPGLDEIIVVDQTPASKRKPEVYAPYISRNVRVVFLDRAGQSTARNTGIEAASGEWCLLFDDDQVAWEDLLAQHIAVVEYSGAHVSTGVALAPWKTAAHIPAHLRHHRAADVLATGNCLVHTESIRDVGGLDEAFDRGSGADDDLGVRLYLNGCESVFNPHAIMTHYKAPAGGLRLHGAWWRDRTTFWAPYPPQTQIYAIQKRYPRSAWWPHYLRFYLRAGRQHAWWEAAWLWASAPWKLGRALRAARMLWIQPGRRATGSLPS
jgi:GT2 family glycosyltransferase